MRNDVLAPASPTSVVADLADRAVDERRAAYTDEVQRLLDAACAVMRESGDIEPRVSDVVRTAGLSNQAFYRHFASKDALLLAVLTDGRQRLLATLTARMDRAEPGAARVAAWVEGVLAQAQHPDAAANTRPFAVNAIRIGDRYPEEWAASRVALLAPLRAAVADAGGDPDRDAEMIEHVAFGAMENAMLRRSTPDSDDVDHIVQFCLRGLGVGAEGADRPDATAAARG